MEPGSYKLYQDDDIDASFDFYDRRACLHCNIKKWDVRTLRKCYKELGRFLLEMEKEGALAVYTISPNPKFCELMGGVYCSTIQYEGKPYGVYKWELKQQP